MVGRDNKGKGKKGPRGGFGPRRGGPPARKAAPRPPGVLSLQKLDGNRYMLVAPRCAQERDLDIEEVHHMRDEDEPDVARDELLFLVEDCRGFLEAYNLLAELAIEDGDIPLARGHFGFGYESVLEALPHGFRGVLPSREGYNPHFYLAGRGLARCLIAMQQPDKAREVLKRLLELDPTEPDVRALLEDLESGGAAAAPSSAPPAT